MHLSDEYLAGRLQHIHRLLVENKITIADIQVISLLKLLGEEPVPPNTARNEAFLSRLSEN